MHKKKKHKSLSKEVIHRQNNSLCSQKQFGERKNKSENHLFYFENHKRLKKKKYKKKMLREAID